MTLLAVRNLEMLDTTSPVTRLELDVPQRTDEGFWECNVRIFSGDRLVDENSPGGADALQAIVIGIGLLRGMFEKSGLPGNWCQEEGRDCGLPEYLPTGLGQQFDERLRTLVADEVARRVREFEERHARGGPEE